MNCLSSKSGIFWLQITCVCLQTSFRVFSAYWINGTHSRVVTRVTQIVRRLMWRHNSVTFLLTGCFVLPRKCHSWWGRMWHSGVCHQSYNPVVRRNSKLEFIQYIKFNQITIAGCSTKGCFWIDGYRKRYPDNKVHGANMGPIWSRQDPGGPHVGPMNFAIWGMYTRNWSFMNNTFVSLLNRLFRRRSKKTSKLRVTGLCVGNSPGPVNSPHKGPVTQKCFHLMTSSCTDMNNSWPAVNIITCAWYVHIRARISTSLCRTVWIIFV